MRIRESFPHAVREIENCWIPMADGARLAARIWLPEAAPRSPVPAILEYIPYRKRDGTRRRDEPIHGWFAGHGYAAVRVDLRGSGESDGLLLDEYLPQEQSDGVEVIRWIAAQPWCDGRVGMMGKSWGGFNSLQVAARRPPELKAILTVCSTDDRYADDAHYMGGCLLGENLIWGSVLLCLQAQAPDPELLGPRWREVWRERLEHLPLYPAVWLRHQRRDAYWKQGSVCEDFGAIECPVYAVGGWADGYTNAVPRLLAGLRSPRKGLVGPWAHLYPHQGVPRPAIGFLQEALRWWDHWLKGIDRGLAAEPAYRVWMQESVRPRAFYAERPGRWVAEAGWPSPRIRPRRLFLAPGRLAPQAGPGGRLALSSPETVGLAAGSWCGFGLDGEMPTDQREDDARSLVFDSEPLGERLEILGAPGLEIELTADRPRAQLCARLNDVAPDGSATRVTYGLLNLTHRAGHEHPLSLTPGERFRVRLDLNDVAHAFPAGHRLRIALSTGYWPIAWPSPERVTARVFTGPSFIELPVRPPSDGDARLAPFGPPEGAPPPEWTDIDPGGVHRRIERDELTGEVAQVTEIDFGEEGGAALSRLDPIGLEIGHALREEFRIREGDPLSARAEVRQTTSSRRGSWSTGIETVTRLSCTRDAFRLEASLEAFEGGRRVVERLWDERIEREWV